jgi:hypothetical protein
MKRETGTAPFFIFNDEGQGAWDRAGIFILKSPDPPFSKGGEGGFRTGLPTLTLDPYIVHSTYAQSF